ncbi:MAG: class II glutamine amidotransferase [Geminicoccaceae bacterium]
MCRLYGLRATAPTTVACCLVRARNSLMAQSRRDLQGFCNADGWGIAAYRERAPSIRREASAAHQDDDFRAAAEGAVAQTLLAHVRHATVGAIRPENTHPFGCGAWSFVHNGTVPYFEQIADAMLSAMTPEHRAAIRGSTDSEHLFHFVLARHEREPERPLLKSLMASLRQVLAWCRAIGDHPRLGLNVLLTDGERMVGSRWQRTLAFVERAGTAPCEICGGSHIDDALARFSSSRAGAGSTQVEHVLAESYRALVIASEPTTAHEAWQEVPERSAFEVTPELRLRILSLEG